MDFRHCESNFRVGNYAHNITYKVAEEQSFAVMVGRYDYRESNKQIAAEAIARVIYVEATRLGGPFVIGSIIRKRSGI